MVQSAFQDYFKGVKGKISSGTEFTPRTDLENFLNAIKPSKKIKIIQEPSKDEEIKGRPDFKVEKNGLTIGYIETKAIDINLDDITENRLKRDSEQLKKYIKIIPNLILTNYKEFILFRNGIPVDRGLLFYPATDKILDKNNIPKISKIFENFFSRSPSKLKSPKKLSNLLAERTRLFRDFLEESLKNDADNDFNKRLVGKGGLHDVIKETLIEDLSLSDFIDAYVQTITYGLFLAEISSKNAITESNASKFIPESLGIIRDLFKTIDIEDIPDSIDWIIEEIIDILNRIDREQLKNNLSFSQLYDYEDPYVYFYENFLGDYDKTKRKSKGVYYTPIPVVKFIVKSIDYLIRQNFDNEGLRGSNVNVLDFSTGTGTFLLESFMNALKGIDEGMKQGLVSERLLKNFYGFEYLIAPYTIAHLKLSQYLKESGCPLKSNERLKIYLTDTLDNSRHEGISYFQKMSKEGDDANKIKLDENVLVLMGNPPYNVESKNNKKWIMELSETYKNGLNEKNIKPLNDDYIKFIRYAHWKVEEHGKGIIGIISNNSYLDGLVHRVMRKELFKSFDQIYILNLHGNKRKGDPDENVFDIMAGVAIALFIKLPEPLDEKEIYYYSTLEKGLIDRELKYGFLLGNDINLNWDRINPVEPYYWFKKNDTTLLSEYEKGWLITDIFNEYESGIKTQRDPVTTHVKKQDLTKILKDLIDIDVESFKRDYNLPQKEGRDWSVETSKKDIIEDIQNLVKRQIKKSSDLDEKDWDLIKQERFKKIQYRPFYERWSYFSKRKKGFIAYPRWEIMKYLIERDNLGLVFSRQVPKNKWKHVFITDKITDGHSISSWTYVTPLYLNNEKSKQSKLLDNKILDTPNEHYKIANFTKKFIKYISSKYTQTPNPYEIFGYIYAVFHSNVYREKFDEFLKLDFPRIPFVDDFDKFMELSKLGKNLIDVHLLKNTFSDYNIIKYPAEGDDIVEKIKFEENSQKLYINKEQYFENVPKDVWEFEIGDYKVLDKWMKYQKGKKLSYGDINHFKKIVHSIMYTINIMDKIDELSTSF